MITVWGFDQIKHIRLARPKSLVAPISVVKCVIDLDDVRFRAALSLIPSVSSMTGPYHYPIVD